MDINIGDYVRTTDGIIGKVVNTFTNIYPEPWEIVLDNGIDLHEEDLANRDIQIKSHSENLIDLIEVGDIVNNHYIFDKGNTSYDKILYAESRENYDDYLCLRNYDIKTILTHEQYEENCYKVD